MKLSMYNHYFKNDKGYYIYNANTNALLELEENDFHEILKLKEYGVMLDDFELKQHLTYGGMLVDNNFDELKIIEEQMYSARFSTNGLSLTIAPTMSCNMSCPYCYERNATKKADMNKETIDNIINLVKSQKNQLNSFDVTWYGGEPLLKIDTIEYLSEHFLKISKENEIDYRAGIITNGYLLDLNMLRKLKNLNVNFIQISFDGDEEHHNKTRHLINGKGSYKKIINNLESFKDIYENCEDEYPRIHLRVNTTRTNMKSINKLIEELTEKQILKFTSLYFAQIFDYEDDNTYTLTDKEFIEFQKNHIEELENIVDKKSHKLFYYPKRLINNCTCDLKNSFIIDPKGNLYKCWEEIGQDKDVIGNVNLGMKKFKSKKYYQYLLFNPTVDDKCSKCDILPLCMGGECPIRRVNSRNEDCDQRRDRFLKNMYTTFKKLGYENIEQIKELH